MVYTLTAYVHYRNELVLDFDRFIEITSIASDDLLDYNSHIGRAVEIVLSLTRWTKRRINEIAIKNVSKGALHSVTDKVLSQLRSATFTEKALLDLYIKHTQAVENEIDRLITEAQALLTVLKDLDDRLGVVHSIVVRESSQVIIYKEEILSQLWTILGGKSRQQGDIERQLELFGQYRAKAYAHVSGTMLRLQEIRAGLEDLLGRVRAPESSAIPLSVHIESIQSGLDRLEAVRSDVSRREEVRLRSILDRGKPQHKTIYIGTTAPCRNCEASPSGT